MEISSLEDFPVTTIFPSMRKGKIKKKLIYSEDGDLVIPKKKNYERSRLRASPGCFILQE
jgi:hypothetical protein